ncbi:MAG: hypothetical protein EA366_11375 [Spirulina sp. DLM2.Bin59]|nr:MAG: hypothetical protein EA366_11375 [Spirulina sp. DLM2.Bin59]
MSKLRTGLTALCLAFFLLLTACAAAPPSEFDQAQRESTERGASAVADDAVSGGSFNRFFPKTTGSDDLVYTQEKTGFAQAKLIQAGDEVALLSVSDISSNPNAADKFADSTQSINDFPVVAEGNSSTAMLVGDRFQIKIQSRADGFTEGDRLDWLKQFDLTGIAALGK